MEDTDRQDNAAWHLLTEFTLPIDPDTPDRVVARVAAATTELHLPEVRLRQVREIVIDAVANHADRQAILIRLFSALPDGPTRGHARPLHGWGLFSIQKMLGADDALGGLRLVLEVYLYT